MRKVNKRIPGFLPPPPKSEIDGKVTDLSSKTVLELQELRDRQLKLLDNKSFISKLSDKGTKIRTFYEKIISELKIKQEEEEACIMLDKMTLTSTSPQFVQNVEWEGKTVNNANQILDSDDDSEPEDVVHILSQSTDYVKKVVILPPEKSLITAEELIKIGENPHVSYLVNKTENNPNVVSSEKFKPFKTTKSDVHNPAKEVSRKKPMKWEVTAATPPPILHGPAKVLNLQESLNLQKEYNMHLKEVEARHAAEKLIARTGIKMADIPQETSVFQKYRNVESEDSTSDMEGSDKEVHDEEPERGGVVFRVMR